MAITAAMVKELREMTGAGMMDCKKALNETNGNMDEAVEFLRKNGQAKAEKKANRIAAEGLCAVVVKNDTEAAVVEVNSETDFVAKNDTFKAFVDAVANQAVASDAADMDAFMAEKWNEDDSKSLCFLYTNLFFLRIYNEDSIRNSLHILDSAKVLLQLIPLFLQCDNFLLWQNIKCSILRHSLNFLKTFNTALDGSEVCKHST